MKKGIQLRGTNATGKTTCVRSFILHNDFKIVEIPVGKRQISCHYEPNRNILVLGRYDTRKCGGCDGDVENRDELLDLIAKSIKMYRPETIIFEGVIYGITYKLAKDLNILFKMMGYQFVGIEMRPPLEVAMQRLAQRNGDKPVNYKSIQDKYFGCQRTTERLQKDGIKVKIADTSKYTEDTMYQILEEEI